MDSRPRNRRRRRSRQVVAGRDVRLTAFLPCHAAASSSAAAILPGEMSSYENPDIRCRNRRTDARLLARSLRLYADDRRTIASPANWRVHHRFLGSGLRRRRAHGLLPELSQKGYRVREVRVVNRDGERVAGFHATSFAEATGGRFLSLPRGDLAAAIFGRIDGNVETIFHDSIASVEQNGAGVHVTFERGARSRFRSRRRRRRPSFPAPCTRVRQGAPFRAVPRLQGRRV